MKNFRLYIVLLWAGWLMGCSNQPPKNVLYLQWLPNGNAQLIRHQLQTETRTPLTPTDWDVFDYVLSPDKTEIIVTQLLFDSSKIWQLDKNANTTLLVDCPAHFCTSPVWQPDGTRLFYEKRPNNSNLYVNVAPQIWWVDLETGATGAVDLPNIESGYGMQFSPDGRWFSYASPIEHSLELFDLANKTQETLHIHTVLPVLWQPNSTQFVAVHDQFNGVDEFGTSLFTIDVVSQESVNLSEGLNVADGPAVWSPDGAWLAFGRKIPRMPMGKQIWLIRADGTESRALTEDSTAHHSFLSWSPDGEWMLFQKSSVQNAEEMPAIYRYNISTDQTILIAENAIAPQWQ
jgi:Tol biopolymer transport system component